MQYGSHHLPVRVEVRGEVRLVTLKVANDGVPIPDNKIETIFDPLTRVITADNANQISGNLGLGLYITKEVVVAHNGTIQVTSSEAAGTIFTACFPRAQPDPVLHSVRKQA